MRNIIWLTCFAALVGCAQTGGESRYTTSEPSGETRGPQITNHQMVDWTALKSISSIRLNGLIYSTATQYNSEPAKEKEPDLANVDLKFFPDQKIIAFEIAPSALAADLRCAERGQRYNLSFLASPGADVSEEVGCSGASQFGYRWRLSGNYSTTTTFDANRLTIDGQARIHSDKLEKRSSGQDDHVIELHGAVEITKDGCRVVAWRHTHVEHSVERVEGSRSAGQTTQTRDRLAPYEGTSCSVVRSKNS